MDAVGRSRRGPFGPLSSGIFGNRIGPPHAGENAGQRRLRRSVLEKLTVERISTYGAGKVTSTRIRCGPSAGGFVMTASTCRVALTSGTSSRVADTTTHSGPGPGRLTATAYDPSVSVCPVPATDVGSELSRQTPDPKRTLTDTGALAPLTAPKTTTLGAMHEHSVVPMQPATGSTIHVASVRRSRRITSLGRRWSIGGTAVDPSRSPCVTGHVGSPRHMA
jgi:hypothetical protein